MEEETIAYINDADFGLESVPLTNPRIRVGARGIVIRDDGKISLFNENNKGDYKLPGGGVEGGETPEQTFKREVYEEVGCEITDIREVGLVFEERSHFNFQQVSHVFIGRLVKDLHELHLTAKERVWGGKMLWVEPKEALRLVTECMDNLKNLTPENEYHLRFMVLRDRKILEYFLGGETFGGEMEK